MFWKKNDSVIRDAVLREMDRGGQVYYLYNKVGHNWSEGFQNYRSWFQRLPIGYVHGQMSEIQLENTLLDFIEGQYDISGDNYHYWDRGGHSKCQYFIYWKCGPYGLVNLVSVKRKSWS